MILQRKLTILANYIINSMGSVYINAPLAVLIGYLNNYMGRHHDKYARRPYLKPFYDIYHSNFGIPLHRMYWLADIVIVILAILWLTVCDWQALEEIIHMYIAMYSIRLACISCTSGYVSPRKLHTDHQQLYGTNNCFTDMCISGHLLTTCILAFSVLDLTDNIEEQSIAITLIIMSFGINLLNGDHYTSDLILGVVLPYIAHYGI